MIVEDLLYSHAGLREARAVLIPPIALLHVLTKGEFDEAIGSLDLQLFGIRPPSELD